MSGTAGPGQTAVADIPQAEQSLSPPCGISAMLTTIPSITDFGALTSSPDNTAAIHAAFNASQEIYIPVGRWNTQPLTWPATLTRVWGPGTLVGVGSPAAGSSFISVQDHGFAVRAFAEKFSMDLSAAVYAEVNGLQWATTSMRVSGLSVNGGAIQLFGSGPLQMYMYDTLIEDCYFIGYTQSPITLYYPNVAMIRGNTMQCVNAGGNHCVVVNRGADCFCLDNNLYGGNAPSMGFGVYFVLVQRGKISGDFRDTPIEAIVLDSCTSVHIDGAVLDWDGPSSKDYGISIGAGYGPTKDCSCRGVVIHNAKKTGIAINNSSLNGAYPVAQGGYGVSGFRVEGGLIVDCGWSAVGIGDGLGGEQGIVGTRVFGLTAHNDVLNTLGVAVQEQRGPSGAPSNTKVTCVHAPGLQYGAAALLGSGSTAQYLD